MRDFGSYGVGVGGLGIMMGDIRISSDGDGLVLAVSNGYLTMELSRSKLQKALTEETPVKMDVVMGRDEEFGYDFIEEIMVLRNESNVGLFVKGMKVTIPVKTLKTILADETPLKEWVFPAKGSAWGPKLG